MGKHMNYEQDKPYRDRETTVTKKNLVAAVGTALKKQGFQNITLSAVARESGHDKRLIYHYFGSFEKLKEEYLRSKLSHGLWDEVFNPCLPDNPSRPELIFFLKSCHLNLLKILCKDEELRCLLIWNLNVKDLVLVGLMAEWNAQMDAVLRFVDKGNEKEARSFLAMLYSGICMVMINRQQFDFTGGLGGKFDFLGQKDFDMLGKTVEGLIDGMMPMFIDRP